MGWGPPGNLLPSVGPVFRAGQDQAQCGLRRGPATLTNGERSAQGPSMVSTPPCAALSPPVLSASTSSPTCPPPFCHITLGTAVLRPSPSGLRDCTPVLHAPLPSPLLLSMQCRGCGGEHGWGGVKQSLPSCGQMLNLGSPSDLTGQFLVCCKVSSTFLPTSTKGSRAQGALRGTYVALCGAAQAQAGDGHCAQASPSEWSPEHDET